MVFLNNVKLRVAIPAIAAVPLVLAIAFGVAAVQQNWQNVRSVNDLQALVDLSATMSALVHEQQKERGLTSAFVSSKGTQLKKELDAQRQLTDTRRTAFLAATAGVDLAAIDQEFANQVEGILGQTAKLDDHRNSVNNLSIPLGDAIGFFTKLNAQHLNTIASITEMSSDPVIVAQLVVLSNFLKSKERAGIERAVGSAGFAAGEFSPALLTRFQGLIVEQNAFLDVFKTHATQSQLDGFDAVTSNPIYQQVQDMRDIAVSGEAGLGGITSKVWFTTITNKINTLKEFEDRLTADVSALMSDVRSNASNNLVFVSSVLLIAVVAIVGLVWALVSTINKGINEILSAMGQLSAGDLNVELPPSRTNEIGDMVAALQVFKNNALEVKALNEAQAEKDRQAREDQRRQALAMADQFEARVGPLIGGVTNAVESLSDTVSTLARSSRQTKDDSATVAAAAEESTVSVEGISQAMNELSSAVAEVNAQIGNVSHVSHQAVERTDESDQRVQELNGQAEGIEQIISLIREIAEQTNLLALNATIEAARAGEAGKGFAVVAAEVKALAAQTSKATEEISTRIAQIQETTGRTVDSIVGIRDVISEINDNAGVVASAVTQQNATVEDIANRLNEVAQGSQIVSQSSQTLSQAADTAGDASGQIESAAHELVQQSQGLKTQVDNFLAEVRSAA